MSLAARRGGPEDQATISALITECGGVGKFMKRFGKFNLANMLENAQLSMIVQDKACSESEQAKMPMRCAVIFSDGPRGEPEKAEALLEAAQFSSALTGNTIWVDFGVTEAGDATLFEHAIKSALETLPTVDHVLMPVESSQVDEWRAFEALELLGRKLLYCPREKFAPTLLVREATVEDNDDLLPIFEQQSEALAQSFGEFFLAEIIAAQDEQNRALVATGSTGRAVGLIAFSTDFDVSILEQCFHLEVYDGLVKDCDEPKSSANAIAVTLFCLDEAHRSRAIDFLRPMFALFPDREYCILTAPSDVRSDSHFLRTFVVVPPKLGSTFSHTLFLLHRDALLACKKLRVAQFDETIHAARMETLVGQKEDVLTALERCVFERKSVSLDQNPNEAAFAAVVDSQVVGIVVLDRRAASTNELNWIKANYEVEDYVSYDRHRARAQAFVLHIVVNPVFVAQTRFIIKESMRLYDKSVIYHWTPTTKSLPPAVLTNFEPVRARRHSDSRQRPSSANNVTRVDGGLLHIFSRRIAAESKRRVNSRIVLVGMTTCSVGFFRTLFFESQLNFGNVTLISPDGLRPPDHNFGVSDCDRPDRFELDALGLSHRVKTIHATITQIDRHNRAVVLPDGAIVPYDWLVLTNGVEESTKMCLINPEVTLNALNHSLSRVEDMTRSTFAGSTNSDVLTSTSSSSKASCVRDIDEMARLRGFVSLSSRSAAQSALTALLNEPAKTIVVYGGTLHALAAVEGLLSAGFDGSLLKLVVPNDKLDSLGDAVVDRLVATRLESLDLADIHFGLVLDSLVHADSVLLGARFNSGDIVIDCDMLLGADALDVSFDFFRAVNNAGLVYDGRLVVDNNFRTSDECIYAAGPHTKFSDANKSSHRPLYQNVFNELELGTALAMRLIDAIDRKQSNLGKCDMEEEDIEAKKLRMFYEPQTVSASLPGNLFYCRAKLPAVPADVKSLPTGLLGLDADSRTLDAPDEVEAARTGVRSLRDLAIARGRYAVLKVDTHGFVTDFVYIGKDTLDPRQFAPLVGLHEAWLNSAVASYDRGLVDDWVDFFTQDWASALRFDRFDQLRAQILDLLLNDAAAQKLVSTLLDDLHKIKDADTLRLLRAEVVGIGGANLPLEIRDLLHKAVLGYLRKNRVLLTRFHLLDRLATS